MTPKSKTGFSVLLLSYVAFVFLGLDQLLGVAWPFIRRDFVLEQDAMGAALLSGTLGYMFASFASGRLMTRLGVGPAMIFSSGVKLLALVALGAAPGWWVFVGIGFFSGAGSGVVDAGLNTYIATHYGPRQLNWLHACFGLGATVAPLIITQMFNWGLVWRWSYVVIGLLQGVMVVAFVATRSQWKPLWRTEAAVPVPTTPVRRMSYRETLRLPLVWLGIALFFVYTGTEGAAGNWSYTLFYESRGVAASVAGIWVSIYWAALTVGRVVLGLVIERIGARLTLRLCMIGTIVGALLITQRAVDWLSFLGLALVGFALAPIFPTLIAETPGRVGNEHAPNAIGFEVGAAGIGIALLPGLAGILARNIGLEVIGPFIVVIAVLALVLHEMMLLPRWSRLKTAPGLAQGR